MDFAIQFINLSENAHPPIHIGSLIFLTFYSTRYTKMEIIISFILKNI